MESQLRRQFFVERNLNSPITDVLKDILLEEISLRLGTQRKNKYPREKEDRSAHPLRKGCRFLLDFLQGRYRKNGFDEMTPLETIPFIDEREYQVIMNSHVDDTTIVEELFLDVRLSVRPIIRAHLKFLDQKVGLVTSSEIPDPSEQEMLRLSNLLLEFEEALARIESSSARGGGQLIHYQGKIFGFVLTTSACLIRFGKTPVHQRFISFHHFLMIKDCLQARRNALLACTIMYPENHSLYENIQNSWKWQDFCIFTYGNKGFEIAKSTESLSKTFAARRLGDILSGPDDSHSKMVTKINAKEDKIRRESLLKDDPIEYLSERYQRTVLSKTESVQEVFELFGLQKLCCHPTIDLLKSGRSLREIAQERDTTLPIHATRTRVVFRRSIILEFIRQKHRWPRLRFFDQSGPLWRAYESQRLRFDEKTFKDEEYLKFEFEKEFDFDYFANYLELLDDKAVTFGRDDAHLFWDKGNAKSERRLLLEIFGRTTFSIEEVINLVEEDIVPLWMFVEALVVKEKEFKIKGRNFGLSYPDHREFFAATEANLKSNIFKLMPEISMSKGKIKIHEEFLRLTKPLETGDLCHLSMELDLESWNSRWRGQVVEGPARDINSLFGMKRAFSYVHQYYEKSLIYLRAAGVRPEGIEKMTPPESDLAWTGHKGGVEGRAQSLWSILTVITARESLEGSGYNYRIIDQGDNIILVFTFVRDWTMSLCDQTRALEDDVLRRCQEGFGKVGQILKPEECVVATSMLTYSKVCYGRGAMYETLIKAAISSKALSATSFPSFSGQVGSLFAGAYSAAEVSHRPERCYWYALFVASLLILSESKREGLFSPVLKMTQSSLNSSALRFLLVLPPVLGGFPIIGPYEFFYRGGGDPTSKAVAGLKILQDDLPEARQALSILERDEYYNESPLFESLIKDPYGLPILKPQTADTEIAEMTFESLKAQTKNVDLRSLFNWANDEIKDDLLRSIKTMNPFNSVVARDLFDCSIFGTVESVKKMFLTTQTVQKIVLSDEDESIHDKIIRAAEDEVKFIAYLKRRSTKQESRILTVYSSVEKARSRWQKAGVKIQGVTSYLPIDFEVIVNPLPWQVGVRLEVQPSSDDLFYTVGKNKPYFGSATREKRSEHGYKIVGTGSVESALRDLQSILSWSCHSEAFVNLIDNLSMSRAGIKLSEFSGILSGILGGDVGHRYEARVSERGAYLLGYTNFASHCMISTDNCGFLSATVDDYKVMFQEIILYLISLAGFRWDHYRKEGHFSLLLRIGDLELDKLEFPPLDVTRSPTIGPTPIFMKFAQSSSVTIKRTTGYLENEGFRPGSSEGKKCREAAVVSKLLEIFNRRSVVSGLIGHQEVSIPDVFGVQEMRGIGIRRFLELSSVAIYDCLAHHLPSRSEKFVEDSSVVDLISSYSSSISEIVLRYWDHPIIQEDEFVMKMNLSRGLRYQRYDERSLLLRSEISRIVWRSIGDKDSVLFRIPVVVFGSDPPSATFLAYKRLLRRHLHFGVIIGEISDRDASFVLGSSISRTMAQGHETEEEELKEFSEMIQTFGWYGMGKDLVSDYAKTTASRIGRSVAGCRVLRVDRDSSELIREYRFQKGRRGTLEKPFSTSIPVYDLHFSSFRRISSLLPTRTSDRISLYHALSRVGRPFSNGVSTVRSWSSVSRFSEGKKVLIIGSGEGGCAVVCLLSGAVKVHGHDLRSDYPGGVALDQYNPRLVSFYRLQGRYQQTYETLSTSGDFFDREIAASLLLKDEGIDLILIDIPSEVGRSPEVIKVLFDIGYHGLAGFRVVGDDRDQSIFCGSIFSNCSEIIVSETVRKVGISERIYFGRVMDKQFDNLSFPCWADSINIGLEVKEKLSIRQLTQEITAFSGAPADGNVRKSLMRSINMTRSILGSKGTTLTHEELTGLLASALTCDFLLDGDPKSYFRRLCLLNKNRKELLTRVGNLQVSWSPILGFLLEKKGPCLIGYLNHKV